MCDWASSVRSVPVTKAMSPELPMISNSVAAQEIVRSSDEPFLISSSPKSMSASEKRAPETVRHREGNSYAKKAPPSQPA